MAHLEHQIDSIKTINKCQMISPVNSLCKRFLVNYIEWNWDTHEKQNGKTIPNLRPIAYMTGKTATKLQVLDGQSLIIYFGIENFSLIAKCMILPTKERGLTDIEKSLFQPRKNDTVTNHCKWTNSSFCCPTCQENNGDISVGVVGLSSFLFRSIKIHFPTILSHGLIGSISPFFSVHAPIAQDLTLHLMDVIQTSKYSSITTSTSHQLIWDMFDQLQTISSEMILRHALEDTIVTSSSELCMSILGRKIIFSIASVTLLHSNEIQPSNTSTMSQIPSDISCYICQRKFPIGFRIPCTVKMTTELPVSVSHPKDNRRPSTDCKTIKQVGVSRIGGSKNVIKELRDMFIVPLMFPSLFNSLGITPPKGVLLYGPPGTGKTYLAKALAEEISLHWNTIYEELCPLLGSFDKFSPPPGIEIFTTTDITIGSGETAINDLFSRCQERQIRTGSGTLIFIDEIDSLCPNRETSGDEERRIVSCFLTHLDGLSSNTRIVLLAATNRQNAIDPAFRRAGRLDREIEIGVPSGEDRVEILSKILEPIHHNLTKEDIHDLAWDLHAFVPADMKCLCTLGALKAIDACTQNAHLNTNRDSYSVDSKSEQNGTCGLTENNTSPCLQLIHLREALKSVKPSAMKEVAVEVPCVKWTDIGGYSNVKQSLQECVEWPIKYRSIFAKLQATPPRGILLYGPPGCSKTLLAKAVATESKMNFIAVKGPELFSKWVGESERAVREVFRKARQNAPCVIFFDEIDALGGDRQNSGGGTGVESRVLSQMLNEMDGIGCLKQVIIIGATNRPDILDAALLRPGRIDRLVYVPLPDVTSREEIIRVHLKIKKSCYVPVDHTETLELQSKQTDTINQPPTRDAPVGEELVSFLSEKTHGYTGAEIAMVCREAAMFALREQIEKIENEKNMSNTHDNGVYNLAILWRHIERSLQNVQPRISSSLIQFYEDYNKDKKIMSVK